MDNGTAESEKQATDFSAINIPDFLFHSISEIQNMIRAVDTKLGFILTLILIPLSQLGKIVEFIIDHCNAGNCAYAHVYMMFFIILACCWFLSLVCSLLGIGSIYDPAGRIKIREKDRDCLNSYFNGKQFDLKIRDIFSLKTSIQSRCYLDEYLSILMDEKCDKVKILAFEQLKSAYIRDMKIKRQTWALMLTCCWLLGGITVYVIIQMNVLN